MRLLRVNVISAATCGGLLDGLDITFRNPLLDHSQFAPLCLIGPNGAGKSQLLQVLAEIFQSVFHACVGDEERIEGNPGLQFVLEYLIRPEGSQSEILVRLSRQAEGKRRASLKFEQKTELEWIECGLTETSTRALLPTKIVGYTSGDNETLSLPFLVSRSGYAEEVGKHALSEATSGQAIPDTRLMLIDYGTHLEVLVANLLLGSPDQREALLMDARLESLHSFRCIVQLAHAAAPKAPSKRPAHAKRKGIQLTEELETYIENLRRCSTSYTYDEKTETYIFDFWVNDQTQYAFRFYWTDALHLYAAFHKLAMLNDLAIPRATRERFRRDTKTRRFASRLPEPQDEDKVFRFERVSFVAKVGGQVVDYVSLSDGEHQLAQLLGTLSMLSVPNVLFLLDEPESHFNPQWRVKLISRIFDIPAGKGTRRGAAPAADQELLLTTHAPFVPSDMPKEQVLIFGKQNGKVVVKNPDVQTYGSTFDTILAECFDVRPPISRKPVDEINELMDSTDPEAIQEGLARLGHSVEKVLLANRLRQLKAKAGV